MENNGNKGDEYDGITKEQYDQVMHPFEVENLFSACGIPEERQGYRKSSNT